MIIFLTCSDSSPPVKWRRRFGAGAKDTADATAASEAEHMYNEPIKYPFNECCLGVQVYYFNFPGGENVCETHTAAHWSLINRLNRGYSCGPWREEKPVRIQLRTMMFCQDQRSIVIQSESWFLLICCKDRCSQMSSFQGKLVQKVLFSSSSSSPHAAQLMVPSLCCSA